VAEARASRGEPAADNVDEPLPPGVKNADFKTLQEMIARGIQDAETGASQLEGTLKLNDSGEDERRHLEELRKRREADAEARQREREAARLKRQKEDEERRRRQAEELEREERGETQRREELQKREARCRSEYAAACRIQKIFRGRRSRAGVPIASPCVVPKVHAQPWEDLFAGRSATPQLLV